MQKFGVERFDFRNLRELAVGNESKISNRSAALENFDDMQGLGKAQLQSLGLYDLKQHQPWFDECLPLFNQSQPAKMQWIQESHQSNIDNLNNVICQASRYFWNKKKQYLTAKIDKLETTHKIRHTRDLYKCINHFHKGYQPELVYGSK